MEVLALLVMGAVNIACFVIGAKVGQATARGEDVKLPEWNPAEAYRKHKDRKEAQKAQSRMDVILQNIDGYDGTGIGQKDVPKG